MKRSIGRLAGLAAATLSFTLGTGSGLAETVDRVLGCTGTPCRVTLNRGGEVGAFVRAARELVASGRRVVIDGPCLSACAIFADRARRNVCITPRAQLGFHQGYEITRFASSRLSILMVRRFAPAHSRDISRWIGRNGGYPANGFIVMPQREALRIWKRC